jgi:hypothetical protein
MARRQKTTKRQRPKTILRSPDLEHSKNAVVNSLAATSSQESYSHAIDEFIGSVANSEREEATVCVPGWSYAAIPKIVWMNWRCATGSPLATQRI